MVAMAKNKPASNEDFSGDAVDGIISEGERVHEFMEWPVFVQVENSSESDISPEMEMATEIPPLWTDAV